MFSLGQPLGANQDGDHGRQDTEQEQPEREAPGTDHEHEPGGHDQDLSQAGRELRCQDDCWHGSGYRVAVSELRRIGAQDAPGSFVPAASHGADEVVESTRPELGIERLPE